MTTSETIGVSGDAQCIAEAVANSTAQESRFQRESLKDYWRHSLGHDKKGRIGEPRWQPGLVHVLVVRLLRALEQGFGQLVGVLAGSGCVMERW
jgi:hypothetical protein